jgi:hypothetical protein
MDSRNDSSNSEEQKIDSEQKPETETTALALPNAEFGKSLLAEAKQESEDRARAFLIVEAVNLNKYHKEAIEGLVISWKQKVHYEKVLKAISEGDFRVTKNGTIVFNDSTLKLGRYIVPGQFRNGDDESVLEDLSGVPEEFIS